MSSEIRTIQMTLEVTYMTHESSGQPQYVLEVSWPTIEDIQEAEKKTFRELKEIH